MKEKFESRATILPPSVMLISHYKPFLPSNDFTGGSVHPDRCMMDRTAGLVVQSTG